jgi:hypothetical protein
MKKMDHNLGGQRFGKLVASGNIRRGKHGRYECLCHCDCGTIKWILISSLKSNRTKSCGCWWGKLEFGKTTRNDILSQYKHGAKLRQLSWELTDAQFDQLTADVCFFCGRRATNIHKSKYNNGDFIYNGIDRIDSSLGYNINNTVACCIICNRAKSDLSLQEFNSWIQDLMIYANRK